MIMIVIVVVIASFGVALMLRSLIQLFFGVDVINYADGIQFPVTYFQPVRILERHIYIVFGAIMLMLALHYMLTRTRTGKAMRAMSDDADLARVSGINTERVVMWTWILGAGLVAIAGVFLGMDTRLVPTMGWDMLLSVFAAAILGGLGQPYGAIAGGLIIGTLEEFSTYPWFGDTPFISAETLEAMVALRANGEHGVVALGFRPKRPGAYGRLVLSESGELKAIVEAKDANATQSNIGLCNSGAMAVDGTILFELIDQVGNENASGAYSSTDIVEIACRHGRTCGVVQADPD